MNNNAKTPIANPMPNGSFAVNISPIVPAAIINIIDWRFVFLFISSIPFIITKYFLFYNARGVLKNVKMFFASAARQHKKGPKKFAGKFFGSPESWFLGWLCRPSKNIKIEVPLKLGNLILRT
jgi:hypothetical protein